MIPTPHTLHIRYWTSNSKDDHGNDVPMYSGPTPWPVHAIAPGAITEPTEPDRDAELIMYTIYAPATLDQPGARDLVVINGVDYPVDGRPRDWTFGPWPFPEAGIAVYLRRVEG